MKFQSSIVLAVFACVVVVHCQEQVSIGKVGSKSFYLLDSPDPVNWDDAVTACAKKNLRLAAIENASENDLMSKFLVKRAPNATEAKVWLGGNDKATEGQWVWTGSNKPLAYKNWDENEPTDSTNYSCMFMVPVGDNTQAKWKSNYYEFPQAIPVCQSV